MKAYEVDARREGRWWEIDVPELDVLTQARRFAEIEDMARSVIAITADVAPSSFDLNIKVHVDNHDDLVDLRREVDELRAAAAAAEDALRSRMRQAAADLVSSGVPVRDIGEVLGVSHQRVSQLIDA